MARECDLNMVVSDAIQIVRHRVRNIRISHPAVKHDIFDYPAVIVACCYVKGRKIFWGQSESPLYHNYSLKIKKRLERLGEIGTKRDGCNNVIGACAEPHAADKVINKYPGCGMDELQFSRAYRPRTGKKVKYCINCKDTFFEVL